MAKEPRSILRVPGVEGCPAIDLGVERKPKREFKTFCQTWIEFAVSNNIIDSFPKGVSPRDAQSIASNSTDADFFDLAIRGAEKRNNSRYRYGQYWSRGSRRIYMGQ